MLFVIEIVSNEPVQVEWNVTPGVKPVLFRQMKEWKGVRVHRAKVMPGRMLEHAEACHEINVTLEGKLTTERITAGGILQKNHGAAGGLCFTPRGQVVRAQWDEPLDNMGIILDPDFVLETAIENHLSSSFEFAETARTDDPLIKHIGLALLEEATSDTPAGTLYADSLIQTLVLHLLNHYTIANSLPAQTNGGLSGYRLRQVQEFIDANLDSDLGLAALASVAGLSQYHFARAFRKTTGMTPQQYLTRRRIEHAKELLSRSEIPLVEVGLRAGFKNQSHFTTIFRKFTRLTPKTWRDLKLA